MIEVPASFQAMPRWWADSAGRVWLDDLPEVVERRCRFWDLAVDGPPVHGSNALVVPVRRGTTAAALRLAPPGDDVEAEAGALRHWSGHGVVALLDIDAQDRALLLERLDHRRSLTAVAVPEALEALAQITRRLAIPAPLSAPSTRDVAEDDAAMFPQRWAVLAEPTSRRLLDESVRCAARLASRSPSSESVNGDLHHEQVLTGSGGQWVVIDPVLMRGDREYDAARALWSRLDQLGDDVSVRVALKRFAEVSDVPFDRARDWVVVRSMSYLLWGLSRGLTEDPPRCRRLLDIFG